MSFLLRLLRLPAVRALGALLAVFAIGMYFHANGAFLRWDTHRDMLRFQSVAGILACGMTLVIITGGIDLAVGSVLALSAVLFSLFSFHYEWSAWLSIPLCLLAGALCGGTSGGLVAIFRIQPFIATLAMMVFARGLAKYLSGGQKVSYYMSLPDGSFKSVDIPAVFNHISHKILDNNLAVVTVIFVGCLLLTWLVLAKLRWGRYLYAVGGNEEASRLSGVPVGFAKMLAYGLSGVFAAVAGICYAAQEQQGDPEAGFGYELPAIAMVVIGGTSLNGGRGSIWLTLCGVMTIGYLEKILSINGVKEHTRLMLTGAIIVAAVLLQKRRR